MSISFHLASSQDKSLQNGIIYRLRNWKNNTFWDKVAWSSLFYYRITRKFTVLDNAAIVFEAEVDMEGNFSEKSW